MGFEADLCIPLSKKRDSLVFDPAFSDGAYVK